MIPKLIIHFAKHGEEAIKSIQEGKGDLLLLDLNMPVLDGYGTIYTAAHSGLILSHVPDTCLFTLFKDIEPIWMKNKKRT